MGSKKHDHPYIWLAPGRMGGEACLGGTRLPAAMLATCWWERRYTLEGMLSAWGQLTRDGIICCWWFMAVHGSWRWRRRWRDWADWWQDVLWEGRYDEIEMPPQKDKEGENG